ncbi:hypothetical protein [Brachyspira hampsonii]|uniref:Uncharacterized protein n=1 Tax=Brachyspira hampsonii TaxID=1287055 RepID=A0AAC9TTM8_9SPIR|nr:hypothetical protein [Brachyspira hampsonii]ASJ21248.1 hypothetical protein BHAMNSH16_06110 [Brachyspira hampsonii]ELV04839.1 hypothetical protein H263_13735 [Brachyspira hampsonii 30599]MBW5380194.1 hypothetical protein [Brachyspira hampsonii]MBW5410744.1 hypothetical protein [Brachyspira hampsonii]OEJ17596.1 hypothetical protein A9496_11070 [Brachyspira hampsonii]
MIKKTIYLIFTILLFLPIISCGKNVNNSTSPIAKESSEYTVKGLDAKYNTVWKFFNDDKTGNNAVDVVIDNGGIKGLIVSNKTTEVNFTKDDIYSIADEKKNKYYDRYFGYIVSSPNWVGEIQFPTDEYETVGYVYIRNKRNSDIIAGIIDKAPDVKEKIEKVFQGNYTADDNKRSLNISDNFVTYSENNTVKLKIPYSFLELSKDENNKLGYTVFSGLLYSGVWINSQNSNIKANVDKLNFIFIDYNYKLDITLRDDGVPISAKYNKIVTVISPENIQYSKAD